MPYSGPDGPQLIELGAHRCAQRSGSSAGKDLAIKGSFQAHHPTIDLGTMAPRIPHQRGMSAQGITGLVTDQRPGH